MQHQQQERLCELQVVFATYGAKGCHLQSHGVASGDEVQPVAGAYCAAATALTARQATPVDTCGDDDVACRFAWLADAAHAAAASVTSAHAAGPHGHYTIFALDRSFVATTLPLLAPALPAHGCAGVGRQRGAWVLLEASNGSFTTADMARIGSVSAALAHRRWPIKAQLPVSPASEVTAAFALVVEDAAEVQGWDFQPWQQVRSRLRSFRVLRRWCLDVHDGIASTRYTSSPHACRQS